MSPSNAEKPPLVSDDSSAEFWDILIEIYKIFGLFPIYHIVEMNIFIAPLEVMDDSSIGQLLLHDEHGLEKFDNVLINVDVVILSDHGFLIGEVHLVLLN